MTQFKDSRDFTVRSGAAFPIGTRLKFATNPTLYAEMGDPDAALVAEVASAAERSICTATRKALAAGELTCVRRNGQGTALAIANGAIDAGAEVYAASAGKVAASGTVPEGFAMEAATANNDVIEVMFR